MKIELTKIELEDLDRMKPTPGFIVLKSILGEVKQKTFEQSAGIKTRTIINGNVSITETADTQLAKLAGFKDGVEFMLNQIDQAHKKLSKN